MNFYNLETQSLQQYPIGALSNKQYRFADFPFQDINGITDLIENCTADFWMSSIAPVQALPAIEFNGLRQGRDDTVMILPQERNVVWMTIPRNKFAAGRVKGQIGAYDDSLISEKGGGRFTFRFNPVSNFKDLIGARDIVVSDLDPRQDHIVTWTTNRQTYAIVQVYQGSELKHTAEVTTQRRAVIPRGSVAAGNIKVVVTVWATGQPVNNYASGFNSKIETTAKIADLPLSAADLTITGRNVVNIDEGIIVTWNSVNQTSYRFEMLGKVYEGTTGTEIWIPARYLNAGPGQARLTVYNTINGVSRSVEIVKDITTTDKAPAIVSLEPDGVNQNVDKDITVSWASKYQDRYKLELYEDNRLIRTYYGTTQTEFVIPANTLKNNNAKVVLTIYNTINTVTKQAVREAHFVAYGTPETPIWTNQSHFTTNKPVLSWTATGQVSYKVEVLTLEGVKADESGEVISSVPRYTVKKVLSNKTSYKIRVSIKNQYRIWSKWAEKQIYISYTSLAAPELSLTAGMNGNAVVSCQLQASSNFKHCEVWRRTAFSDWVRVATGMGYSFSWEDTTLASGVEYFYRIWAIDNNDAISESDVKSVTVKLSGCILSNIEDLSQTVNLGFNVDNEFEDILNVAQMQYLGNSKPSIEYDSTAYVEGSLKFTVTREELEKLRHILKTAKVLLYRDSRGEKLYCKNTSGLKWAHVALDYYDVEFNVTEINYIEKDYHKGTGHLELVYFDGKYFWNDGLDFSGFVWVED